ncbi:MAG: sulfate ABC transporter permease subunit CysT [Myxococcaceae bacterium]
MAPSTAWLPLRRRSGNLPGYRLALGFTLVYLSLLVLLPLGALLLKASTLSPAAFVHAVTGPRAFAAYRLSLTASLVAALVNVPCGLAVTWVLTRYRFPGRALLDALVDLPFALPTAVAGIALTAVYAKNGWLGRWVEPLGLSLAYTRTGVVLALIFVGLPFVVRTVEPVLRRVDPQVEEAAAVMGSSRLATFFRVLLPPLLPALLTGFALSFARGLGEYGSVVFISGNMPLKTEIAPLLIVSKLEEYDYAGATAIAVVMLATSFLVLLAINLLQARMRQGARR